jgi:hypothetical protein
VVLAGLTVSTVAYLGLADSMPGGAHPLGWLWLAVAIIGSVCLSRGTLSRATLSHADVSGAMSVTAYWLAALSALGLVAAALMVRAARAARSARA